MGLTVHSWLKRAQIVLASLAIGLGAQFLIPSAAHASGQSISIFQFNMCGNRCNGGSLTVAKDVENSVNNRSPQPAFVTLEEICENQYWDIWNNLAPYYGTFIPTGPTCSNGQAYGIAILTRTSSYSNLGSWNLPNPYGHENRKMGCLQTSTFGGTQPVVACVTHIDYHSDTYASQISWVANQAHSFWSGHKVLVMGDFNVTPWNSAISPMYNTAGGTGIFYEADEPPSGSRTYIGSDYNEVTCGGKKIDYVFLSEYDFYSNYWGDATYASNSDHAPLWAGVQLI